MKIKILILVFFLGLQVTTTAQPINVFQGKSIGEQTIYGKDIMPFFVKSDNLLLAGEYEKAIIVLDNVVAEYPQFAEGYMKRAMALYRVGRLQEAQRDYQTAIKYNPYIADLYGYNNDLSKLNILAFDAIDFIEKPSLSFRLDYYNLELFFMDKTMEEADLEKLEQALLDMDKKSFTEALVNLYDLAETYPYNPMIYDLIGVVYEYDQQYDLAIDAFEKAISLDTEYDMAYFNLSMTYTHLGKYQTALDYIDDAIMLNPDLIKAYFHRAVLYKKLGQPTKAIVEYDRLQERKDIVYYEIYLNRAISKKVLGDINGAIMDIDKAISLAPENATLYKIRGNIKILQRNYREAINDFTRAIELDNNFAEAYFNRGVAQLLASNRAEACKDLEYSISLGYVEGIEKSSYFCGF